MRDYIREQLLQCVWANPSSYDEATCTFFIPRYCRPIYQVGGTYVLQLPNDIIGNPQSVLAVNYNKGSYPIHEFYTAYITNAMGSLIHVVATGYDPLTKMSLNDTWTGWLDTSALRQIAKV